MQNVAVDGAQEATCCTFFTATIERSLVTPREVSVMANLELGQTDPCWMGLSRHSRFRHRRSHELHYSWNASLGWKMLKGWSEMTSD